MKNTCLKEEFKECCCECQLHYSLYSHPLVNGKPMSSQIGYICLAFESEDKAVLSSEHGLCEMFIRKETENKLDNK